jgi:hypothetical protein
MLLGESAGETTARMPKLVLLARIVAVISGALPTWPRSRPWDDLPCSLLDALLVLLLPLVRLGRLERLDGPRLRLLRCPT